MSELGLHKKALVYLLDYYESEQYDPTLDYNELKNSIGCSLTQLLVMYQHIKSKHNEVSVIDAEDDLKTAIVALQTDLESIEKLFYARADVGD